MAGFSGVGFSGMDPEAVDAFAGKLISAADSLDRSKASLAGAIDDFVSFARGAVIGRLNQESSDVANARLSRMSKELRDLGELARREADQQRNASSSKSSGISEAFGFKVQPYAATHMSNPVSAHIIPHAVVVRSASIHLVKIIQKVMSSLARRIDWEHKMTETRKYLDGFFASTNGKKINYEGDDAHWCFEYFRKYSNEGVKADNNIARRFDEAFKIYELYETNGCQDYYVRIPARSVNPPGMGDVIVFGKGMGPFGHVGIVDRVEDGIVYYYDQNGAGAPELTRTGYGDGVTLRSRPLNDGVILGYLRPRRINNIDNPLLNEEYGYKP